MSGIPMAEAVLFRDVVALAGRFPALAGVDLSVGESEVVVLVGPNGAGKTSLLRACAGLLPIAGGEAVVLGYDLRHNASSVRRHVGLLGHTPSLYDDLTVRENVRFAVRAGGGSAKEVDPALERLGLGGRLSRTQAGKLSAGQRRRVCLAVLSARRLDLWLLDEPHAGLDSSARSLLSEMVKEASAAGTAVLLASHELAVSAPMAHRVVQIAGGRVTGELRDAARSAEPARPQTHAPATATEVVGTTGGGAHVA